MIDNTALIMGAGYVGTALARELTLRGVSCETAVASKRSAERLKKAAVAHRRIDLDGSVADLPSADCVVYLIPPRRTVDTDERLREFLKELPKSVKYFLYVSTSGVYGDQQGKLIDETTPASPHSARAHRRLDAENQVKNYCESNDISWIIARVPGIYGPGRLPLRTLEEARPIIRVSESNPGNRIHRDDLASALADLIEHARKQRNERGNVVGEIFNVSDNNHMSGSEFALAVAKLSGISEPPQISREAMKASASSIRWSFLAESRRLDSSKLRQVLSKPLRYSDPLEGIIASLEAPDDPAA